MINFTAKIDFAYPYVYIVVGERLCASLFPSVSRQHCANAVELQTIQDALTCPICLAAKKSLHRCVSNWKRL